MRSADLLARIIAAEFRELMARTGKDAMIVPSGRIMKEPQKECRKKKGATLCRHRSIEVVFLSIRQVCNFFSDCRKKVGAENRFRQNKKPGVRCVGSVDGGGAIRNFRQ
jgi:hypothetical protein